MLFEYILFKYSRHSSYVECNDISNRSIRSFSNLFFKFNVSLPLVTGELLQKKVDKLLPQNPQKTLNTASCSWLFLFLLLPLPVPDSLRILQWIAGGLRARSTEQLHIISSHPVDLICIQESTLNLSFSFQIPGFSALQSDRSHSRSGIFSTDVTDASSGVIIFVRQGLSFSELSTSSLSSLDPYSIYVKVSITLNDFSTLSFLNVYAPPIRSSLKDSRTNFFSPSILPSSTNLFILGDCNCHQPL